MGLGEESPLTAQEEAHTTRRLLETIRRLEASLSERDRLLGAYRGALRQDPVEPEADPYRIVTAKEKVDRALAVLDTLYTYNGGYIASSHGRYRAVWLRDMLYCAIGKEYVGDFASVGKTFGLVSDIFHKYSEKMDSCIDDTPTAKTDFLHARFNPYTLEEFPEEWGHNQLDIFGLFLYKLGDLQHKGIRVVRDLRDLKRAQDMVWYLYSVHWNHAGDFGMWEEGPEFHSSSVGAVLAGLQAVRTHIREIRVPARFITKGREALDRLLPRESESRPYDLAQLSLIWPYRVVTPQQRQQILENVEQHLVREHGVVRYPGDFYYNANPTHPHGNEGQWPMGFAWLSIVYTKMAEEVLGSGDKSEVLGYLKKAHYYIKRLEGCMVGGSKIPELYIDGRPNENTPLAWAQAIYVVAVQAMENLKLRYDRLESSY